MPFPIINFGALKVNQVSSAGMVNMGPINIPIGSNSQNKTNRTGDNYGDISLLNYIGSNIIDTDLLDQLIEAVNIP
ncbi:spore germination protein [Desulfotruncus arcticus]|uniref:spore germination protein n=1 Tax=Desulfotruncus arcticus TaxID=341036 RepID=UPI0013F4D7C6|nr:spore germination protein [Desulfotruncus arcticus]